MKRYWPVPASYSKKVPEKGARGAFKINNYYKKLKVWHTGIDIFCPTGSKVVATEDGEVVDTDQFTGPPDTPQYRRTWFVAVKIKSGNIIVYGEIRKSRLKIGQKIKAGQIIGFMAAVEWAKNEPKRGERANFHFELYRKGTKKLIDWWHKGKKKPKNLLNPTNYLKTCTLIKK